ncbi:monovalent cation/H+ antiporter complex subunit F [Fusibacter bizertensis]|jgi:Multiple resistance and pH regulation protein F (MrpF / PhaF).|uniref:Monovalent cation/H+ antiporter complex subunit F n=1 Tax=Fusibacter bizertensis TaxID=1488331 RepID=A0ABT6NBH5_9FIRM|nr:monovalent cation/H+ antiporter complex subunit F [Fusibacter bizertensis]MDH8677754.1 monovalent cation/H+ antiporter complex subunit F [Fusibacter bizertensis]
MTLIIAILVILTVISAIRILIGPSLWDRLLGLNLVTSKLMMLIILVALVRKQTFILDLALVYALLSFMGIIFIALFIQRKGRF